ncbi:DUF1028 domain-containing protein [Pedobacter caeni]|uniref:Uncharacterized conserved protein, Ntn-hydrolase superfamily n=1 Tax=Pedobacter caeni TaxID=288992 RepID=A0A1M5Q4N8_9SPHI|nr:DUF1028 domain-containing protein [Pedobacter caeni]SHH08886.1 Uncharacterized conserved protein, Ntn-hydrolase superfamily [Pedobacter caeni]
MYKKIVLFIISHLTVLYCSAQNLPSLLLDRNINSTFSIIAYDSAAKEWGIAVATNNIYVGNSTVYIQPGLGAFSVIAETDPDYAINGFAALKKGKSVKEAIESTRANDEDANFRQIAGIDSIGNVYAYTGSALKFWKGDATHLTGKHYVVLGNQLAEGVLSSMAKSYEHSTGTLAERLLTSIRAGQDAGGQITGKQSAALMVKGAGQEWYNQIDLRVDDAKYPLIELQRLLNFHYGRIKLNQAIKLLKDGEKVHGLKLLNEAGKLVEGWNGIYSKLIMGMLLGGEEDAAVKIILKAIKENPDWKENLPCFYFLANRPELRKFYIKDVFSEKDWNQAIQFLIEINKPREALKLTDRVIGKFPRSSYPYYLKGEAYRKINEKRPAVTSYEMAVLLDKDNEEAVLALKRLKKE